MCSAHYQTFKECFKYFAVFYFDQQRGGVLKTFKKLFVDCNIVHVKLFFVTPTNFMVPDAFREVHTYH